MVDILWEISTVYPKNYAHSLWLVLFCCSRVPNNLTHILQDDFTDKGVIIAPAPLQQPYTIWLR